MEPTDALSRSDSWLCAAVDHPSSVSQMKDLKILTLNKGQWYDRDEILLHAAFQVLVDFMEQERPAEIVDWEHDEVHSRAWSELSQLYRWWKEERPQRREPLDDVASPPEGAYQILDGGQMIFPDRARHPEYYATLEQSQVLEDEWFEEDQRQLHRLIDARPFLWT
jgi:hypothetical protein